MYLVPYYRTSEVMCLLYRIITPLEYCVTRTVLCILCHCFTMVIALQQASSCSGSWLPFSSLGASEKLEFQAETRKLLDIVAKSLYSEKEVSFCITILLFSVAFLSSMFLLGIDCSRVGVESAVVCSHLRLGSAVACSRGTPICFFLVLLLPVIAYSIF